MARSTTTYAALALALALAPAAQRAWAQQTFDTPESAAEALIGGAAAHDGAKLAAIFGPKGNAILTSGNLAQDTAEQEEFARRARAKHQLVPDSRNPNRVFLSIGEEDWPFPAPIVRANGKWSFDASGTRTEMLARQIGANELDAISVCLTYVQAQKQYAVEDHDKDGMPKYASRLVDGLPEGFADAVWDGQKKGTKPYHGYFFRILDGQGPNAPGGAHSYLLKDRLIGGFGLVAWPAQYGVTGIQTFIVNQAGVIYQKDMAPPAKAKTVAPPVTRYDPDPSWMAIE